MTKQGPGDEQNKMVHTSSGNEPHQQTALTVDQHLQQNRTIPIKNLIHFE